MNSKPVVLKKGVVIAGVAALMALGSAYAESRTDVLERIRPVGTVNVAGEAKPAAAEAAAPAAQPAAEPAAAPASAAGGGEAVFNRACMACHTTGAANAPKVGDNEAWAPRIEKGMDALMQSALNGIAGTAMAPRGGCADCSDDDLKAAIEYMISKSQ